MKKSTLQSFEEKLQILKELQEKVKQDNFYGEVLQMQKNGLIPTPTFNLEYGHTFSETHITSNL